MNKNSKSVKRGRPVKPLTLPKASRMTVNDIWAANPHIKCRLSIYTKVGELVKAKVLRPTGETAPSTGKNHVGKPLDVFQTMKSFRLSRAAKKAARTVAKNRKLGSVTVDIAPPVPAPADPVTA